MVKSKILLFVNPLSHMPIVGSSNSAANKDTMSEVIWQVGIQFSDWVENIVGREEIASGKGKKLLVTSNFFFSRNVFESCLLLMR